VVREARNKTRSIRPRGDAIISETARERIRRHFGDLFASHSVFLFPIKYFCRILIGKERRKERKRAPCAGTDSIKRQLFQFSAKFARSEFDTPIYQIFNPTTHYSTPPNFSKIILYINRVKRIIPSGRGKITHSFFRHNELPISVIETEVDG